MKKLTGWLLALLYSVLAPFISPVAVLPDAVTDTSAQQSITVMNYNVYISGSGKKSPENRTNGIVGIISDASPDSFGLEEADEGWIERISAALPNYAYTGSGRNNDLSGEASPVFYLADKYELVSSETIWLSPTPETPSRGWDAWINRVATIAVLKDKATGFTYAHINAHFDNSGAVSRIEAAAVISKKAASLNMPVVFTGDLNAKEGSLMYNRILEAGFTDTKYAAEISDSGATYHGYAQLHKINEKPIDYIFVNSYCQSVESYAIIREKVDGIYPSDHFALCAECTFSY